MTDTAPAVVSTDARRSALAQALRKYRGEGYAVALSPDGLTATLTRKRRIKWLPSLLLALITMGLWLFVLLFQVLNRKTETVLLYVDERGQIIES